MCESLELRNSAKVITRATRILTLGYLWFCNSLCPSLSTLEQGNKPTSISNSHPIATVCYWQQYHTKSTKCYHLTRTARILQFFSFSYANMGKCTLNPTVVKKLNNKGKTKGWFTLLTESEMELESEA